MKFFCTFLLLILLAFSMQAQREFDYSDRQQVEEIEKDRHIIYIANVHLNPVKGLDDLTSNNYPKMNKQGYQFRFRYGFGKRKLSPIFDFSYYNRLTENSTDLLNTAKIRAFGAGIGHNLNLIDREHFFLKPMYLINFSWYKIVFTENLIGNTLADALNSDYKEFTAKSFQVPVQVGINLGFKYNRSTTNMAILIGAGYNLNYTNNDWIIGQKNEISNNINLSSFYLSLGFISFF